MSNRCIAIVLTGATLASWGVAFAQPVEPPAAGAVANQPEMTVDEAIEAALAAIDRLDDSAEPDSRKAAFNEAQDLLARIQIDAPTSAWILYLSGRLLAANQKRNAAIDALERFVEKREGRTYWKAHRSLGDLFVSDYPRLARMYYEKADALTGDEPTVLFGLSQCAVKLGDMAKGVELAARAVEADGRTHVGLLIHLATVLVRAGRLDEALNEAMSSLELTAVQVRNNPGSRGPLRVAEAQYSLLIDIAKARVQEDPQSSDDYLRFARFLRQRGLVRQTLSLHDALEIVELGISKGDGQTTVGLLEERARLLEALDRQDEAIKMLEAILGAHPDNPDMIAWLERLRGLDSSDPPDSSSEVAPAPAAPTGG